LFHQGTPAPGGSTFGGFGTFSPGSINNAGQVVFPSINAQGDVYAIARPGTKMPGGGTFVSGSFFVSNFGINNPGDVVFNCTLSTGEEGVYSFSHGKLSRSARGEVDSGEPVSPMGLRW
jgi:hypothetical protein